ncbi:hypothetical protein [Erythrobacter ani]|uniref:Uncharacterized protein n=1 Tax=Erythrobacter ani TaxID=2827235 RepID=A0ABS6SR92_9SPHN|nr:hypothetical protein [Erythrobacter ani]MBV7267565.1 hypothetical protein [Erythrobacter ani]
MTRVVACVSATDGVAVAPCGTVDGEPLTPVVVQLPGEAPVTSDLAADLYVNAVTLVLIVFVVGLVVGSMMRVIRSA